MSENNVKKLTLYCLDCVRSCGKSSGFNNLKSNKENKIIVTESAEFGADNREIIEMMTLYALNKSTMGIYKGSLILEGSKGRDKFYSPLLFAPVELVRLGDKIIVQAEEMSANVGLISSLLENDVDIIENTINQLLDVEAVDFKKVISGLINLNDFNIKDEKILFLTKTPESVAGLINELKLISSEY